MGRTKNRGLTPISEDRGNLLTRLYDKAPWDAVVVGSGTSSRGTKLVHGGVRYLAQGGVKLVREVLVERALILRNAPRIAHRLEFVVRCHRELDRVLLRVGLGLYDALAGARSIGPTRWLARTETLARLPGRHLSDSASVSREHAVLTECGGLLTIVGGKWTTYRKMAVDSLAAAARAGVLPACCRRASRKPKTCRWSTAETQPGIAGSARGLRSSPVAT